MSEAITREEKLLNAIATGETVDIVPVTRKEKYLRYLAGIGEKPSKPITRQEMFLDKIQTGAKINNQDITITTNGTYTADEGYTGLGTVNVSVVPTGDGNDVVDSLIDRSITEITSNVTSIGEYTFNSCSQLTTANFPLVKSFGNYAFYNCSKLTTVNFPIATSIGEYVFQNCSKLTTADFPLVTNIGTYAFNGCTALTTADFPLVTSTGGTIFGNCSSLTTANFPAITSVEAYTFYKCSNLTTVDFPLVTSINIQAFRGCSKLTTLILRSETMATLGGTSVFTDTPIASGTGYIYVPSALVSSYQSATNWSTYSARFRALEDYTVDGTISGELDWDKINVAA